MRVSGTCYFVIWVQKKKKKKKKKKKMFKKKKKKKKKCPEQNKKFLIDFCVIAIKIII